MTTPLTLTDLAARLDALEALINHIQAQVVCLDQDVWTKTASPNGDLVNLEARVAALEAGTRD